MATPVNLEIGDTVTVLQNDARVAPGSVGRYIGIIEETGCLLVDVEGRGRVSFTPDSVRDGHGEAVVVQPKRVFSPETRERMSQGQRARHAAKREQTEDVVSEAPTPARAPAISRELYLDGPDTAAELGIKAEQLKRMAAAINVGTCRAGGCKFTARDIGKLRQFQGVMTELGTGPAETVRLMKLARKLQGTGLPDFG